MKPHHVLCVLTGVLIAGSAATADRILLRVDASAYDGVEVIGLVGQSVAFRSRTHGNVVRKPMDQVARIELDDQPNFNRAESLFAEGQYAACIGPYEAARRDPRLQALIDMRLLVAYDQAGRFDKAVTTYIDVLSRSDGHVMPPQPQRMPRRRSRYLDAALAHIDRAVPGMPSEAMRRELKRLKLGILVAMEHPGAAALAEELGVTVTAPARPDVQPRDGRVGKIQRLVDQGQHKAAWPLIDPAIRSASTSDLPVLLLAKATCQLAMAATDDERIQAALAAMRVVVHFPASQHVPVALDVTAQAHEALGETQTARSLYRECRAHPQAGRQEIAAADRAIARLEHARQAEQ